MEAECHRALQATALLLDIFATKFPSSKWAAKTFENTCKGQPLAQISLQMDELTDSMWCRVDSWYFDTGDVIAQHTFSVGPRDILHKGRSFDHNDQAQVSIPV